MIVMRDHDSPTRICPGCGRTIEERLATCPFCGLSRHSLKECEGCIHNKGSVKGVIRCDIYRSAEDPILKEDGTCLSRRLKEVNRYSDNTSKYERFDPKGVARVEKKGDRRE